MKTKTLITIVAMLGPGAVHGQAPWSGDLMQRGITAVTCGAMEKDKFGVTIPPNQSFTFGLFDLRNPSVSDYGPCNASPSSPLTVPIWDAPQYHHASWNVENIGNVFGITIDSSGDMYLGAHGLYGNYKPYYHRYGNLGGGASSLTAAGTIYRVSKTTGVVTVFAVIPGQQAMTLNSSPSFVSGPGLGNLTFDRDHNQFFVTSLEDGKIYRLDSTGTILNSFDPMTADSGAVGMPPKNERLWAVEYENNQVFYSVWNDGTVGNPSVIRKVDLLPSGDFAPSSDALVLSVPGQSYASSFSPSPVSDITFSLDGQTMVLGVRTMTNETTAYNHASGTHVVQLLGSTWTHQKFQRTGCNVDDGESFGGVALGEEGGIQDSILWSSSADMAVNFGPHGIFGVRMPDVPLTGKAPLSWKAPYVPGFTNTGAEDVKGSGGDVEIMRERDDCADLEIKEILCPKALGEPYTLETCLTHHLTTTDVFYYQLKPCPAASLPAGAITLQPTPSGIQTLSPPLTAGTPLPLTITLPGVPTSGGTVCFLLKLLSETGEQCCLEKVCVDLPDCACAEILDTVIKCEPDATGLNKYTLTFTVRNLTNLSASPFNFLGATFLPPTGFDQSSIVLSPASIPPGGTGTVTICYFGTPGPLCFNLALHDGTEEVCCAIEDICIELPPCGGGHDDPAPDTCGLEERVPCCPDKGTATVNFTVCNNSLVPRTYSWNSMSFVSPTCPILLSPGDFSPSSGTLGPIPPGGCATVTVTINCAHLDGDLPCANYMFCATADPATPPLCCRGMVYVPEPGTVVVKHGDPTGGGDPTGSGLVTTIAPGESGKIVLSLENPGDTMIDTILHPFSEMLLLEFFDDMGTDLTRSGIPVRLAPGETQLFNLNTFRIDNGMAEGWTPVMIYDESHEILLQLPVLLQGSADGALPIISGIDPIEPSGGLVEIRVLTMPGRFYQIQQSENLQAPWLDVPCTVAEGESIADGLFLGTGGEIICRVPCEEGAGRMFYRAERKD